MENVADPTWHCYTCRSALRQKGQEDIIMSQTNKLWDRQMTATIKMIPGLAERLQSQGLKQRPAPRPVKTFTPKCPELPRLNTYEGDFPGNYWKDFPSYKPTS